MNKDKRLLILMAVSLTLTLSLSSIFYLALENMGLKNDLFSVESQLQRSENKAQFYLENWHREIEKRTFYYDRLVQIGANAEVPDSQ